MFLWSGFFNGHTTNLNTLQIIISQSKFIKLNVMENYLNPIKFSSFSIRKQSKSIDKNSLSVLGNFSSDEVTSYIYFSMTI